MELLADTLQLNELPSVSPANDFQKDVVAQKQEEFQPFSSGRGLKIKHKFKHKIFISSITFNGKWYKCKFDEIW